MDKQKSDSQELPAKKAGNSKGFVVGIDADAHRNVTAQSKKLNISRSEYASAAIAFFAESGLNPTAERPVGLVDVEDKVTSGTLLVRKQNAEIGTRLISIMRTWEKNLYTFLQQQQQSNLNYLEQIENNIIRHQVAIETSFLSPLIELVLKGNQESYITRLLSEEVFIKVKGLNENTVEASNRHYNGQRDANVVTEVRAFLQANAVAAPGRAPKPVVVPIPKVVVTTQAPAAPAPDSAPGAAAK